MPEPMDQSYDEADTCWHLLVLTQGGRVSILKNLDAPTARQAYQRMMPDSRPRKYINPPEPKGGLSGGISWGGYSRVISDSDLRSVDILGPEGAELNPWRGAEPIVVDLSQKHGTYG